MRLNSTTYVSDTPYVYLIFKVVLFNTKIYPLSPEVSPSYRTVILLSFLVQVPFSV